MILNIPFWLHCWLESEVLIAGKTFVIFDANFEKLQ